jgi:hypothetical protein
MSNSILWFQPCMDEDARAYILAIGNHFYE